MLRKLSVQNFAVISGAEFSPVQGLNVFTGETGAGKSVAISALGFVLGARSSTSLIKDGQDKLQVRAEFDAADLPPALRQKYADGSNTLILTRSLDRAGKAKASVNGHTVTAAALSEIGRELADFYGQHEHQSLLRPQVQLDLLDNYAQLQELRQQTYTAWQTWRESCAQLDAADLSEQEKQRRLDLYTFQLQEIENANPKPGEDEELEQKLPQMKHAGRLLELSAQAYTDLYEAENSAETLLARAAKAAAEMEELDAHAAPVARALEQAQTLVADASAELSSYQSRLHADPQALDDMLSRHEKLKRLKLKYGPELSDVLAAAEDMRTQIDRLQNAALHRAGLEKAQQKARKELDALCETLHKKRLAAAQKLAARIEEQTRPLGLENLTFEIAVEMDAQNPTSDGADSVEFLFSANPGQAPRPLRAAASGGELSRLMLGLKTVLAGGVPVMVFDEVDSGVGGRTATLIGVKLRQAAQGRQVLCVTHLAAVAAGADAHFYIEKTTDGKTTDVSLKALSTEDAVVTELARMLGALDETDAAALTHARQLRAQARNSSY